MQKIAPFLWFNDQAEEAANFYVSVFKKAKIVGVARYGEAGANVSGRKKGSVMTVNFLLNGQEFVALNGGPVFKFTEAISFVVNCKTQKEIDDYWKKLSAGGEASRCGWLKDKYGVSWQVVPEALGKMLDGSDLAKSERTMQALLQMTKLDLKALKKACAGK